ncbi:NUDIX hydrolase [Herbiconiux sp. KACC 21604]|uniref:NUDIX domain-containing protein n=1 Tax=unclassified Herbiconiux TaxID=2618217 RepID=UPI00149192D3|nr:NUDIX hydrolase [Herbiconiux sp. SALV-R1]QJU53073.1 NUDIX hydrolase [Herbiconiux sp. SALV-R1]WPO88008.1 NUDIX hydrolase [Herbiconiux sp. KACC 21604]
MPESGGVDEPGGVGERGLLADEVAPVEATSSEVVFDGYIWDVRRETFAYGDGTLRRDFVDHPGAVAVFALDDDDRVLLIKQYRHPVRRREWEPPAGLLDVGGEPALAAAQRELAEEVDLEADEWHVLIDYLTTPGGNNEAIRIYLARGLRPAGSTFEREGEEADMEQRWVGLDELVDAVLASRVQNPSLVIGALAAQASRARGWGTLRPADAAWPERQGG